MKKLLFAALFLAGCTGQNPTTYLSVPSYETLAGEIVLPSDIGDPAEDINDVEIDSLILTVRYRDGGEPVVQDLLEAVQECSVDCEVPLTIRPGEEVAFDLELFVGGTLNRRGVTVDTVYPEGGTVTVLLPDAHRVAVAAAGESTSETLLSHMDSIVLDEALLLAVNFNQDVVDPVRIIESEALLGSLFFNAGTASIDYPGAATGTEITHAMPLIPAVTCNYFALIPSPQAGLGKPDGCQGADVVDAANAAYIPYQVFGDVMYVRIPYNAMGEDIDTVLAGSVQLHLETISGKSGSLPASGDAPIFK